MKYAVVDLSTGRVTAVSGPAVIKLLRVNTSPNAAVTVNDGDSVVLRIASGKSVEEIEDYRDGIEFTTNVVVNSPEGTSGELMIGYSELTGRLR